MAKVEYLTLNEAARRTGRTVSWIKEGIRQGKLGAKLAGGGLLVSAESLDKVASTFPPAHPKTATEGEPVVAGAPSSPNTGNAKTKGSSIGGIGGYYTGSSKTATGRSSAAAVDPALEARLVIARNQKQRYARQMRDRGKSREARHAAEVGWAEASREVEILEREIRDATAPPPPQAKGTENVGAGVADAPSAPVGTPEAAPVHPPPHSLSPPLGASAQPDVPTAAGEGESSIPPPSPTGGRRSEAARKISEISRRMQEKGYPGPLGDHASGIVLVVEQPLGPRVFEALILSLRAVGLPEAYVTYASTGLLAKELLAIEPRALIAVGAAGARDVDAMGHPLARRSFSGTEPGAWFSWTQSTRGLLLPPLAPALDDEAAKRRFWKAFRALRDLAPTPRPAGIEFA